MSAKKKYRLGDLQLEILKVLWRQGEASVADVHEELGTAERLAYTTVATMLRKMEVRKLVHHREEGRRFVYRAAVQEAEVTESLAADVLERLFEGSVSSLVQHLLSRRDVSADELGRLERLIAERKRRP